jgi:hypothetical protein
MRIGYRASLLGLLVTGMLVGPTLTSTARAAERRVYDKVYRDYHPWTDNEDRTYRGYLTERHVPYRAYGKLKDREQREYWRWHHTHPSDERR